MGRCQPQSFRAGFPLTAVRTHPHRFTQRCARLNLLGLSPSRQVEKRPARLISELCLENLKLCSAFVRKSSDALASLMRTREPVLASFPGARAWSRAECGCRPLRGWRMLGGLNGEELSGTWARVPVKLPKTLDHSQTECLFQDSFESQL